MKQNSIKLDPSTVTVRLGLCAAAMAGTAAAIPSADATVITNNINLAVPNTLAGVYLNFQTGASMTAPFAGWDFNPYSATGANLAFYWQPTPATSHGGVASGALYADLAPGTTISGGSTFITTLGSVPTANFRTTGIHILGFRFFNEATSAINFGYLTFSTNGPGGFPATILSYSYENNGGPITVPVPEPSTNALLAIAALALGAVGVRAWRRQTAA